MQNRATIAEMGGCTLFVLFIIAFFVSGSISYHLVEPHSFLGVLLFLVVWAFVHLIVRIMLVMLVALVFAVLSR